MKRAKGKGKPTRNFSQRLQHNLKRQTDQASAESPSTQISQEPESRVKCDPFKKEKGGEYCGTPC